MHSKPIIRNNTPWSIHGVNLCVVLNGRDTEKRIETQGAILKLVQIRTKNLDKPKECCYDMIVQKRTK